MPLSVEDDFDAFIVLSLGTATVILRVPRVSYSGQLKPSSTDMGDNAGLVGNE